VALPRSTLCILNDAFTNDWNAGQGYCNTLFSGASLCTHQQMRRACNNGGYGLTSGRWLADRTADDQVLVVNGTSCANFDGTVAPTATQGGQYCCLEWMSY
jgi:hypothetical protein